jgi:hypothetical protein
MATRAEFQEPTAALVTFGPPDRNLSHAQSAAYQIFLHYYKNNVNFRCIIIFYMFLYFSLILGRLYASLSLIHEPVGRKLPTKPAGLPLAASHSCLDLVKYITKT